MERIINIFIFFIFINYIMEDKFITKMNLLHNTIDNYILNYKNGSELYHHLDYIKFIDLQKKFSLVCEELGRLKKIVDMIENKDVKDLVNENNNLKNTIKQLKNENIKLSKIKSILNNKEWKE